ncbi:hypothetical protein NDU88_003640 [Pleurodeles waltl]|uniref:Uncharacterized protein n=1 Tax=Pleurodeles waltl TaxID=8319 RepID=A0AAV7WPN9_PLEWA|nr:hypothetical protein NDU88_003640 [Pleurodeles waltl]
MGKAKQRQAASERTALRTLARRQALGWVPTWTPETSKPCPPPEAAQAQLLPEEVRAAALQSAFSLRCASKTKNGRETAAPELARRLQDCFAHARMPSTLSSRATNRGSSGPFVAAPLQRRPGPLKWVHRARASTWSASPVT